MKADFQIENHGSLYLIRPFNKQVTAWFEAHIPEDAQYLGNALAVEPRYVADVVAGLAEDGFNAA